MNKKGFTLIEVMAVIIIIGVILTIAVPAVSTYISDSRYSSYYSTIHSYMETIQGDFANRRYGSFLEEDEILVVPIKSIKLDKSNGEGTPFGDLDYERSYVVIATMSNTYKTYGYFIDTANKGIYDVTFDSFVKKDVKDVNDQEFANLTNYFGCSSNKYVFSSTKFAFNSKNYEVCDYRTINSKFNKDYQCDSEEDYPAILMCEV